MCNEWFLHMSKMLQKDISFSLKVERVQTKMNSYRDLLFYSLICMYNLKNESKINTL